VAAWGTSDPSDAETIARRTVGPPAARYNPRTMNARDLLLHLDPWLDRQCHHLAARLPGLDSDEVYQRVVEEFLEKLERWLQQDATVHVIAQARTLMRFCIRHVETDEIRERQRRKDVPDDDDGLVLERLAEPVAPTDSAAAHHVLALIRSSTSPPCSLCLLSLRLPAVVEPEDAQKAKTWKKGGANAVPRPLGEAWGIFESGLSRAALVADDAAWKEHVGIAWYTNGPVEFISHGERRAGASKVERYANRGAEDLREALLGRKGNE
jgi:hypothetical protein